VTRILLLVVAGACAAAAATNDWTIVPGERVGPITAETVRGDLARAFGADAVEDDEIELDEGMLQPATLVHRKDPAEALAIVWQSKAAGARVKQIFICRGLRRGACRWRTADGIGFGTRLSELETMNAGPFTIAGFGWNYGGNVTSWDGGKLARLDCGLVLTLDGERAAGGKYTVAMSAEELHAVRGDRPIASRTPAMQKLNPRVVDMVARLACGCGR
jgi:hypothetical protein